MDNVRLFIRDLIETLTMTHNVSVQTPGLDLRSMSPEEELNDHLIDDEQHFGPVPPNPENQPGIMQDPFVRFY